MIKKRFFIAICYIAAISSSVLAQNQLDDFKAYQLADQYDYTKNAVISQEQFNGYTNYWHNAYREWIRYGSLYKMGRPDLENSLAHHKADVAEDLGISGLSMQEGFLAELFAAPYETLVNPDITAISAARGNILISVATASETGKILGKKLTELNPWPEVLKNHQARAKNYTPVNAFILASKDKKIFVVSSASETERGKFMDLIQNTSRILATYDLKKGWFGAETLLKSVTCMFGHPLEVMGKAMNEGCSFIVFHGYMDFWAKDELNAWNQAAGNPMVVDVGTHHVFGCRDYKGLQLQDIGGDEGWIKFAREKQGYIFRNVYDPPKDKLNYDGYIATEGNKEQIDMGTKPFVCYTGGLEGDAETSMVLFMPKGSSFNNEAMWNAIMDKRQVAVLPRGILAGPEKFRAPLNALLLDRILLENIFAEKVQIGAHIENYTLHIRVSNYKGSAVNGRISIKIPDGITMDGGLLPDISLNAGETKIIQVNLKARVEAMGKTHPIVVSYNDMTDTKSTMTMMDLPRAINSHTLLYGHSPEIRFPVSVHNFSGDKEIPVTLKVISSRTGKEVFSTSQKTEIPFGGYKNMEFRIPLSAGDYTVVTSSQGAAQNCQLGIGEQKGKSYLYEDDLNADGIKEYRMENKSVRLTLIATGARVIEYYIKNRDDNALFKLWPEKPEDHDRPFRRRGFYPYGGFEDFLGQASMETHQVYEVEIVKKEGDYVQLKMWTDYFGNRLEKTYTLYGDSPLLEVKYALDFINPEANVIGPQPILALGKNHGTEDVYTVPDMDGMKEFRMRPEEYYGQLFNLKEGWNAGYDTEEDIAFLAAFPVSQPLFLHMWMNHDRNPDSHYFYNEFQPWVPIDQKTTMYFTFYMWGNGGHWKEAYEALKNRNLISKRP